MHAVKQVRIKTLINLSFFYLQSTHAHLFLQDDDKLYINQGDSLQKVYHNCKSCPLDPNLMDTGLYSSAGKQGNLFSQSYNICMNCYMSGELISVPNEGELRRKYTAYMNSIFNVF